MESENENLRTAAQELLERDPKQAARIIVDAEISRHVAAAVAAERDRCLKLAEECGAFGIADRIGRGVTAIDRDGIVERIDRAAVLAEREACAKIAEEIAEYGSTEGDTHPATADMIAAKIRGRK
jgi:hypothetical protein